MVSFPEITCCGHRNSTLQDTHLLIYQLCKSKMPLYNLHNPSITQCNLHHTRNHRNWSVQSLTFANVYHEWCRWISGERWAPVLVRSAGKLYNNNAAGLVSNYIESWYFELFLTSGTSYELNEQLIWQVFPKKLVVWIKLPTARQEPWVSLFSLRVIQWLEVQRFTYRIFSESMYPTKTFSNSGNICSLRGWNITSDKASMRQLHINFSVVLTCCAVISTTELIPNMLVGACTCSINNWVQHSDTGMGTQQSPLQRHYNRLLVVPVCDRKFKKPTLLLCCRGSER